MLCEFFVNATSGIHVIPEIEVDRLCLLEGSNGIGKTLAVRLLELATGKQPYAATRAAWSSLKEGLREVRIHISQLRNGDKLEIELTPSTWPKDPAKGTMKLGHAWYNGQSIDIQTIPNILRVTRIAGDEDIIDQFQRIIATDGASVGRQFIRLEALINPLIDKCDDLLQDIKNVSRTNLEQLIARQEQAEVQIAKYTLAYEQQDDIVQTFAELNLKQIALSKLGEQGPSIESRLAEIDLDISKLQSDIRQLEIEHDQQLPDEEREKKLLQEIEQLRNKLKRQTVQLDDNITKGNNTLLELGLSNVDNIPTIRQQMKTKLDELIQQRELYIAPPHLIDLIRQLRMKLEDVRGTKLDTKTVASIGRRSIQVRELRDALVQREQELTGIEQQSFLSAIEADIQLLNSRIQNLDNAKNLQKDLDLKRKALTDTQNDLHRKIAELDLNRDATFHKIAEELDNQQKNLFTLFEQRGALRSTKSILMEHGSFDELKSEIAKIRNSLPEGIGSFNEEQMKVDICRNHLKEAQEELNQAKDALSAFERKLQDTLILLNDSSDYSWLRTAVSDRLPTMNDDLNMALEWIEQLEQAIRKFVALLTTLSKRTGQLKSALEFLAQNNTQEKLNSYLPVIIDYYEKRFGVLFADPYVQHVLFEKNGTFTRLDLRQQVVIWKDVSGETCRSPLEAFSSGERAFAQVLGSILQLRQVTAQNHLLVLDEFGAFIEAGRIERLERILHDGVIKADGIGAVVIILPLRDQIPFVDDSSDRQIHMLVERGYKMKEENLIV